MADLGQQSLPFAEAEVVAADPVAVATEEVRYRRRKSARNRGNDTISYSDALPVERRLLDLPEAEKICAETGEPLVCIGEEVARKLAHKAEQFFVIEYVRPKYASCKDPDQGVHYFLHLAPHFENYLNHLILAVFKASSSTMIVKFAIVELLSWYTETM